MFWQIHEDIFIKIMRDTVKRDGYIAKHHGAVCSMMFSPTDSHRLVSAGRDGTINVINTETGTVRNSWHQQGAEALSVAFSPSGTSLAGSFSDGIIKIYDVLSDQICRILKGHTGETRAVSWSPCGNYLASGGEDMTVRIWDVITGCDVVEPLTGHNFWVTCVSWSPKGTHMASGSADRIVMVWHTETWKLALGPLVSHEAPVHSLLWSPDGSRVASQSSDGNVCIWGVSERRSSTEKSGKWGERKVNFYEICHICRASVMEPSIIQMQLSTEKCICEQCFKTYEKNRMYLLRETVCTSTQSILWSADSQDVKIWSAPPLSSVCTSTQSILWSADSQDVKIWSAPPLSSPIECMAVSADRKYFASGCVDGTVHLWEASSLSQSQSQTMLAKDFLAKHDKTILCLALSPNLKYAATGSADKTVVVWDLNSGTALIGPLQNLSWVRQVAWSPDSKFLACGCDPFQVKIWDVSTSLQIGRQCLLGHNFSEITMRERKVCSVCCLRYSENHSFLTCYPCCLIICGNKCSESFLRLKHSLDCRGGTVQSVQWSPDGKYVLSWDDRGAIYIWEGVTGKETVGHLVSHIGAISSVEWSTDSKYITATGHQTANI